MASAFHWVMLAFFWALLCLPLSAPARADDLARGDTVFWSLPSQDVAAPNAMLTLALHGAVLDGWHVYSLKQVNEGPTPLLVRVESNPVAAAAGAVTESPPTKVFEPALGAQTQSFSKPFTITVPVRLKSHLTPGAQTIPVSIRFQTCNGTVCQPPKTVHLSATVNLQASR